MRTRRRAATFHVMDSRFARWQSDAMSNRMTSFAEFWPYYLREHSKPQTRALHYFGTTLVVAIALFGIVTGRLWMLLLMPLGIAFLPPSAPLPPEPHDPVPLKCFAFGLLFASPVLVLALFLDRAPGSVAIGSGLLLAAVSAGGIGTICLEGRCPAQGVGHRLGEHATIGLCLAAVLYVIGRARGR